MLNPKIEQLEHDTNVDSVIKAVLKRNLTINELSSCSNDNYKRPTNQAFTYITYQTSNGVIEDLRKFLNQRIAVENRICGYNNCIGIKTNSPIISKLHIVIEILQ